MRFLLDWRAAASEQLRLALRPFSCCSVTVGQVSPLKLRTCCNMLRTGVAMDGYLAILIAKKAASGFTLVIFDWASFATSRQGLLQAEIMVVLGT